MAATANILGLLKLSLGPLTIHLFQLPIIFTGLALGAMAGGTVGLAGTIVGAFTLVQPNPFVIADNAVLGLFTGILYGRLTKLNVLPNAASLLAVLGAYLLQAICSYLTDVYLVSIPPVVEEAILLTIFFENMISLLICRLILTRVDILRAIG
jgi:hypothetical protein